MYDGATGTRLSKAALASVSLSHGDQKLKVDIQDDGRFVSRDPLPTWRDYTVTIVADGYRSFVSYNTGIDVPASLAMTDGIAQSSTTQTLDYAAYLFPVSLQSPKLTLTVTVPDRTTGIPVSGMVNGTLRLRPQTLPSIQIGSGTAAGGSPSTPVNRLWANDEDLLTQTVSKAFTDGAVVIDAGELVYGVAYEVAIFDVLGYQPLVVTGSNAIVAGIVTSRTFALSRELQDPLRIVINDAMTCTAPAGTDANYGARITITFNTDIEVVGTTWKEDVDNALAIATPAPPFTSPATYYCPLKTVTAGDPAQERGSRVEVAAASLIFSFNPSVGLAPTYSGLPCSPPPRHHHRHLRWPGQPGAATRG